MLPFNLAAAIVTGIFAMVLGFIWYGPLFAKDWMKEVGMKAKDMKGSPAGYLVAFLASSTMGATMSILILWLNVGTVTDALMVGMLAGVGFVGTTFLTNYIFAQRTLKLFLIDAGYQIVIVTVAAVIAFIIR